MTPDQITQLRQKLEQALAFYEDALFNASAGAVSEALAILPCPTCNGMGIVQTEKSGYSITPCIPCPDCQPKLCVCCEEVTEENTHLHRNCGK